MKFLAYSVASRRFCLLYALPASLQGLVLFPIYPESSLDCVRVLRALGYDVQASQNIYWLRDLSIAYVYSFELRAEFIGIGVNDCEALNELVRRIDIAKSSV